MIIDSGYMSHQPVLVAAFAGVQLGHVLELGSGFGSTPLLHALCAMHDCELVTIDSDERWMLQFRHLERDWHRMRVVNDFEALPEYGESWDIVMVDHAHAARRGHSILRLKGRADLIIAHDSCHQDMYGYTGVLDKFRNGFTYAACPPLTTVVTDTPDRLVSMIEMLS